MSEQPAVGRELDIAVARALGWDNIGPVSMTGAGAHTDRRLVGRPPGAAHDWHSVPYYSTDPAAALAALEQAAAGREWSVDLHTSAFAVGWYCTILDEQTREEYHGEGASLAEAIARAIVATAQEEAE